MCMLNTRRKAVLSPPLLCFGVGASDEMWWNAAALMMTNAKIRIALYEDSELR